VRPLPERSEGDLLEAGVLASTAELLEEDGQLRVAGDPVDGAFLLAAAAAGIPDPREDRELVLELPFDPWRKRLTCVYREHGRHHVLVKGAPEILAARAELGGDARAGLVDEATEWAAGGLRVLAVGERWLDGHLPSEDDVDDGLELVGLVGLRDPLRPTAADSVRRARDAGVKVAMLTGDHPVTAAAIARELELRDTQPLTGSMLDGIREDGLRAAVAEHDVFARITPADKLRLVEALQDSGEVVAVTGDGINDSPALRRADVGVAMGLSGTEAAREAADIVLTDDDFGTIVSAVREGRRIADNIRTFVLFLLSANLGEVVLFTVAVLLGLGVPMTVVQVLTVNLLTDGLPAVALSRDPAATGAMKRPPHGLGALLTARLWQALGAIGVAVGLVATAAYLVGREVAPDSAQTMAFATIALAELALVFTIRSLNAPAWRAPRNPALTWSVLSSLLIVALVVYVPVLREPFGTEPLGPVEVGAVLALALVPAALVEAVKAVRRAR
jgi:Ca2+-transporting ATPase